MTFFTAGDVQEAARGRWIHPPAHDRPLRGIGIDTREDLAGKAFVAIRGERHDGHGFLLDAARAGADLLIVEQNAQPSLPDGPIGVLEVDDTRAALGRMARAWRQRLRATEVIAVTGSVGKTTTKALIHAVLSADRRGSAARRSFNNEIGVPLTILAASPDDAFVVVEIGSNGPGEIDRLASIVEPDVAVITSIGRSHLEGLGSLESVAAEKASLLRHLRDGGLAVVTADAPLLRAHLDGVTDVETFGEAQDATWCLTDRGSRPDGAWFEVNGDRRYEIGLPGRHNAVNALAAIALAQRRGMSAAPVSAALARVEPPAMRMETLRVGPFTVINDAYNANPESVIAGLETFVERAATARRRIVALGEMLELGESAPELHREIGRALVRIDRAASLRHVLFIGSLMAHAAGEVARHWGEERISMHHEIDDSVEATLSTLLQAGDALYLKGSRAVGVERIVDIVERRMARRDAAQGVLPFWSDGAPAPVTTGAVEAPHSQRRVPAAAGDDGL